MKNILKSAALALSFIALSALPLAAQEEPELRGDGSVDNPYLIDEAFDFTILQQRMEEYESYTKDKYFVLARDIRFNSGVLESDGSLSSDSARFATWTPIGRDAYGKEFQGHFDGRGHTISGIYINDAEGKNLGLFGIIAKEGEVSNLKLADSYVCGNTYAGGLVGLCKGKVTECESSATVVAKGVTHEAGGIAGVIQSDGIVSKCINNGYVYGITYPDEMGMVYNCASGGIVGSGAKVDGCENHGTVVSIGWGAAGGIAGSISGGKNITGCINYGTVICNSDNNAGGIVGTNWAAVYNSKNYGQVSATMPGACIGGIAGRNAFNARVSGSENFADIHSDVDSVFVGGIVGNLDGGRQNDTYYTPYTPKVFTSSNHGAISTTSSKSQCGGIAGKSYCGEVHGSHNDGPVTSRSLAGGILPKGEFHSHIYESVNEGNVSGLLSTGGIVGNINGEVRDSRNSGKVSNIEKNSDCGGIVGVLSGASGIVRYCVNNGEVTSGKRVGGIAGNNDSRSSIISSYNAGHVYSDTEGSYMGGVSGGSGTLRNCYNAGTVHAMASGIRIGGVTNNLWVSWDGHGNRSGSTAVNCYNSGNVIVDASGCTVGNIAAVYNEYDRSYLFDNCYYLKDAIYGSDYVYADDNISENDTQKLKETPREDFATLAASINKVEYPWDPQPYIQGRWRPLLVHSDYGSASEPMSYFNVLTSAGDTVAVDLGLPLGNEFFYTDSVGVIQDAYNVVCDGKVGIAALVDEADFAFDPGITVGRLEYIRHASKDYNFSCMPVAIGPDDLPVGAAMSVPVRLEGDTLRLNGISFAAPFSAFMFDGTDMPGYWSFCKNDVRIEPCMTADAADTPMIVGSMSRIDRLAEGSYLLSADCKSLQRASEANSVAAFRAYVSLPATAPDVVGLALDNITSAIDAPCQTVGHVGSEGMTVMVTAASDDCPVEIYSLNGTLVKSFVADRGLNEISLSCPGVYVVRLSGESHKVWLH